MKLEDIYIPKSKSHNLIFFIIIIIITIFSIIGISNLQINNDISVLLPVNEQTEYEREKIRTLSKEFYSDQLLFIGVDNEPFSLNNIKKLWELCNELNKLDVVKSTFNPFNAGYFKKTGPVFSVIQGSMNRYPKTEEDLTEFMNNIISNRYLIGSVISYDKKIAGIVVRANYKAMMGKEIVNKNKFIKFAEFIFGRTYGAQEIDRTYFCNKVEEVIKKYEPPFKIYFAGVPVFEAKSKIYMKRDIIMLLVPVLIIMTIVFFLSLKTAAGTILPFISISLSIIWTMGIIGWVRYKLDTVSMLLPPVIMTVGSSYTLHYLNSYYNFSSLYKDKRTILINSTKSISPTISLAAITTIFGFASFVTARIKPIRFFGIYTVISILFTLFFTYFLISKILLKLEIPKIKHIEKVKKDFFSKLLGFFRSLVIPLRYFWVIIYILCIILFTIYIPKLKIQTNAANLFKKSDFVRQSLIYLQYHFHGTNHYNITIREINNKRNFFKTREGILAAKKIQDYLDGSVKVNEVETIGWVLSPVTLLQDLNTIMTGEKDIPEEKDIKKFFSILQATNDDGIRSIINKDLSAITFQVRPNTTNVKEDYIMTEQELAKLTVKLNDDLKRIAKEDGRFSVEIWGEIILLASISKYLINDQIWSLTSTAILVFLINLIMFRSAYYALLSLIPLSFGVLMNFTIMSILNIPLDASTVMIAAISIGIGIDNSIHFILNYRKKLKENIEYRDAILQTLAYTARPMLFTSLALVLGFIIFIISLFQPVVYFGVLISVSMFNCIFATLFILPSFFLITEKIRFLLHKKNR